MIAAVPSFGAGDQPPWETFPWPIVAIWAGFILACWIYGAWFAITVVRRRRARPGQLSDTKTVTGQPFSPTNAAWTFTGGGNVPGIVGRVRGTRPLARLTLTGDVVNLRLRPGLFSALPLHARPDELMSVHPVSGPGLHGVGFRALDGREWYFLGPEAPVLDALARAGFPVSVATQKVGWRAVLHA